MHSSNPVGSFPLVSALEIVKGSALIKDTIIERRLVLCRYCQRQGCETCFLKPLVGATPFFVVTGIKYKIYTEVFYFTQYEKDNESSILNF